MPVNGAAFRCVFEPKASVGAPVLLSVNGSQICSPLFCNKLRTFSA